jgi:cytoplasmic polyadenylation element-binding protein
MRNKEVQVIPWVIADSTYVRCPSTRLDSGKTVFVGALHGMLSAEALASIFQDLFKGVVYAGIDTDKFKYPIGSGRVVFNNHHSYMKAVSAAFIEIMTPKFTKKIQVDPYLEDALCSHCNLRQGPYYCRDLDCFKYYCRSCWDSQHAIESICHHKPIMRNSRSAPNHRVGTRISNVSSSSHRDNSLVNLPHLSPFEL